MPHLESLEQRLEARRKSGSYRSLKTEHGLVDFVSNDYLSLARDSKIEEFVSVLQNRFEIKNLQGSIHGSTGSRLLTGQSLFADTLEKRIAEFHEAESALLFNSGYDANLGLLSTLLQEGDTALYDERIHASAHDGIRLGRAQSFAFRHNDLEHLEHRLQRLENNKNTWIIVESLYSMDGDTAPLQNLCALAEKYGAKLIVDEAHSTGIFGAKGQGLVSELGLNSKVFARIHTYGKAFGVHGAAVVGPTVLRELLINFSRPFIYSTALPPISLLSIWASYDLIEKMQTEREQLKKLWVHFENEVRRLGHPGLQAKPGPIQCFMAAGNEKAKSTQQRVRAKGFDTRAILSPTVPAGEERLRICLHTHNMPEQITELLEVITHE